MNQSNERYGINVKDYDVSADGTTDDSSAIQRLLDTQAPLLYFPAGRYLIGTPLRLPSHTHIKAHRFAHFRFADGAGRDGNSFLLSNADFEEGNKAIRIEGGIWDGNNVNNPRGVEDDRNGYTGVLLNFRHVDDLTLLDMTLRDSQAYYTRLSGVRGFRVERLRFEASVHTRNQDGVHIAGQCEDGIIRDIVAVGEACTGDDLVALNADDALDRCETRGKLGGPIRRVRVHGLRADDCHSFVRMASVWSPIEDIEVNDVRGGCRISLLNADGLRFCMAPLFRRNDERYAAGVGMLRRIRLRNIAVYKSGVNDAPLLRLEERMHDFEVEGFTRLFDRDAAPHTPTVSISYLDTDSITVDGVGPYELETCRAGSTCSHREELLLPGAGESKRFRIEAGVDLEGRFVGHFERFDRLRVAETRTEELPDPDWMVHMGQYLER